jgi:hypothetical protein
MCPTWIDALKLKLVIDARTRRITPRHAGTTPQRLTDLTRRHWRPQDTTKLETITDTINSWTKAIDDLFATKPIYLTDPCPHCGHTHTRRLTDTGETITSHALAVTTDGAICQHCHDTWTPEFLAKILGYR